MPDNSPDLNAVRVFAKVVEVGSFRGAAEALRVPRSTVSLRIAALEAQLGVLLLQRTTRLVTPTEAGLAYYQRVAPALATLDEADRLVAGLQDLPRGTLRISAPPEFGQQFLSPVVNRFLAAWPEVRLSIDISDRYVDLVGEGYDLAIRAGQLPDSSLIARKLGEAGLRCFASPAYLERHGRPRAPEELAEHDCILFGVPELRATWTFGAPPTARTVEVTGRLAVNSMHMAREAAVAGLGIARLPPLTTAAAERSGALIEVLEEWRSPGGRIHAVYPTSRHLSPKVRAFLDVLTEERSRVPWEHREGGVTPP